jgi:hypothetical protein
MKWKKKGGGLYARFYYLELRPNGRCELGIACPADGPPGGFLRLETTKGNRTMSTAEALTRPRRVLVQIPNVPAEVVEEIDRGPRTR